MFAYPLTWITDQLAVGHAPMSYEELDSIRAQGIDAIVNLCGEYCDLHQIERDCGFDVLYAPIKDDDAPNMAEVEKALEWLDEAIYLGKKVLVHCRFGVGRTGTFVTSYLLRRGFSLKEAQHKLRDIRSVPTSFSQWRFLRRYGKQSGVLDIREPSLEMDRDIDWSPYFSAIEQLGREVDGIFQAAAARHPGLLSCGRDTDACCTRCFYMHFAESAYLGHQLNRRLSSQDRIAAIQRARAAGTTLVQDLSQGSYRCPLNVDRKCIIYPYRPLRCRLYGLPAEYGQDVTLPAGLSESEPLRVGAPLAEQVNHGLYLLSRKLFLTLSGFPLEKRSFVFPIPQVVSGKFVQDYFAFLAHVALHGK